MPLPPSPHYARLVALVTWHFAAHKEDNLTQMVGLNIPVSADCTEGPFVPHNLLDNSSKHGYEELAESQ